MLKKTLRCVAVGCAVFALSVGSLHAQDTTFVPQDSMGMDQDSMMTQDPMTTTSPDTSMGMQSAQTVVEVIEQQPDLSTLAQALRQAGLVDALAGSGPFTILAPSNEAFEQLPADLSGLIRPAGVSAQPATGADSTMMEATPTDSMGQAGGSQPNTALLVALLRHHVIVDEVTTADTASITQVVTLLGDTLRISTEGGALMFENGTVEQADLEASNGVVHIIDQVLVPAQGAQQLLDLESQRDQAGGGMPSDTTGMMDMPDDTTGMMDMPDTTGMMDMETDTSSMMDMEADTSSMQADTSGVQNR